MSTRFNEEEIKAAKEQVRILLGSIEVDQFEGLLVYGVSAWTQKMEEARTNLALTTNRDFSPTEFVGEFFPKSKRGPASNRLSSFLSYKSPTNKTVGIDYLRCFIHACEQLFPKIFKDQPCLHCIKELAQPNFVISTVPSISEKKRSATTQNSHISQVYLALTDDMEVNSAIAVDAVEENQLNIVKRNIGTKVSELAFKKITHDLKTYSHALVGLTGFHYGENFPFRDQSRSYFHHEVMEAIDKFVELGKDDKAVKGATPIRLVIPETGSPFYLEQQACAGDLSDDDIANMNDFMFEFQDKLRNLIDNQNIILKVPNKSKAAIRLYNELKTLKAQEVINERYVTNSQAKHYRDQRAESKNNALNEVLSWPTWQQLLGVYKDFNTQMTVSPLPGFCTVICSNRMSALRLFSTVIVNQDLWPDASSKTLMLRCRQSSNKQNIWQALWSATGFPVPEYYKDIYDFDALADAITQCQHPIQLIINNIEYLGLKDFNKTLWQPLFKSVQKNITEGEFAVDQKYFVNIIMTYHRRRESGLEIHEYSVADASKKNDFSRFVVLSELPDTQH